MKKPNSSMLLLLLGFVVSTSLNAAPILSRAAPANIVAGDSQHAVTHKANTLIPVGALALSVSTPAGPLELILTPATDLQTKAASMISAVRDGGTRIYRGVVAGKPASWVRLSLIDEAWLGAIKVDGNLWLLEPAREQPQLARQLGLDKNDTLIFTMDAFDGLGRLDYGGVLPPPGAIANPAMTSANSANANTSANTLAADDYQYFLGVSLVLDTEFQSRYGSNAQSTAVGILNVVDGFYSADANIQVYLHALEALTDNGPMIETDSGELLSSFRAWFRDSSIPFSGSAQLMSGKNFDGSTVGQAWLGSICSRSYGNGVNQMTFSAAGSAVILAHEMGHNFNLDHDSDGNDCPASGFVMNAITNLGNPPTQFSSCSLDALDEYLTSRNLACLAAQPLGIFDNGFE